MGKCKKGARMFGAAASTFGKAFPFYLLIQRLSLLDVKFLQPCDPQCTFIRYYGTSDLPRTAVCNDPNSSSAWNTGAVFMSVSNGNAKLDFSSPGLYERFQTSYTSFILGVSDFIEARASHYVMKETTHVDFLPAICPSTNASKMKSLCKETQMKYKAVNEGNHLESSMSRQVFLKSIILWALFSVLHDCLVLGESASEMCTLIIGFFATWFQIVATAMGFFWSIGAAEVFFAKHESGECGCYYEMGTLPMLGVIVTPIMLYVMTRNKVWNMVYAVLHGDYLYSVSYAVPYRTAGQGNADPTHEFLEQHNSSGSNPEQPRVLTCKEYRQLNCMCFWTMLIFNLFSLLVVYAFAFPSLTVRFYDVVVVGFRQSGLQAEDGGAWLFLLLLVGAPSYVCYGQIKRARDLWPRMSKELKWSLEFAKKLVASGFRSGRTPVMIVNGPLGLVFQAFTVLWFSTWALCSLVLPVHLWKEAPISTQIAGEVGAAGFYLLWAFLNVWVPSKTPFRVLQLAVAIKGGNQLPIGGFEELNKLVDDYPHLGLQEVAEVAEKFQGREGKTLLDEHGVMVDEELLKKWSDFAKERLDDNKKPGRPSAHRSEYRALADEC